VFAYVCITLDGWEGGKVSVCCVGLLGNGEGNVLGLIMLNALSKLSLLKSENGMFLCPHLFVCTQGDDEESSKQKGKNVYRELWPIGHTECMQH